MATVLEVIKKLFSVAVACKKVTQSHPSGPNCSKSEDDLL